MGKCVGHESISVDFADCCWPSNSVEQSEVEKFLHEGHEVDSLAGLERVASLPENDLVRLQIKMRLG